jgi:hypothetical protein
MSLFIEVESVEKKCKVIINLDMVIEIAPVLAGGCDIFYNDSAAVNGKTAMRVTDSYLMFQQLAMQVVSSDDIAKKVKALKGTDKPAIDVPKL